MFSVNIYNFIRQYLFDHKFYMANDEDPVGNNEDSWHETTHRDLFSTLPTEILARIVEYIEQDPEKLIDVYYRRFLSVESIERPSLNPQSDSRRADDDIRRFRLVCRKFAEVGAPALFTVVATRFSRKGLDKLKQLAGWKTIAQHVRRFSYMVTYSYPTAEHILYSARRHGVDHKTLDQFKQRLQEQKQIVDHEEDVHILKDAFLKFTSLQVVKLLRVTDSIDNKFWNYIDDHEGSQRWGDRYWAPSCTTGSRAIGQALIDADVDLSRYYMPAMHVSTLSTLPPSPTESLKMAARLTCLTLVFEDSHDLDERIHELSGLFETVFKAATNMQAIHIGFPRYRRFNRRFSHPLKSIFHDITWNKLLAFGVAGWSLNADEITELATRHKDKLKGLRLRDISLKHGSRWREVLVGLEREMSRLEWLSLRGIGYDGHEEMINGGGAEVTDDPNLSTSTEDSDDEEDEDDVPVPGPSNQQMNGHLDADDDLDSDHGSDNEGGREANTNDFPQRVLQQDGNSNGFLGTQSDVDVEVDLSDDGRSISREKRKTWEEWVVKHRSLRLIS